ncbi:SDR family NAD(P)-dependent oxidoreductase [Oligoflexaceae bacterium]|nr:SDR family NAD(P)-dependent oxidoreductase [Oligoflexaceae bacterium]
MKNFIVTGASGGIGAEVTRRLARRADNVAIVARSEDKLVKLADELNESKAKIRVYTADLTETGVCHQMVNQLASEWGSIDGLVNNAGYMSGGTNLDLDLESFDTMLDLNVRAPIHLSVRVAEIMKTAGGGTIINIASVAGTTVIDGIGGYCATKFAIRAFSEASHAELKKHGIKVSSICPGYVATDMTSDFDVKPENMIQTTDVADAVSYILDSSTHVCPREIHLMPQKT